MTRAERIIVVTGATGQQGGATARALLREDFACAPRRAGRARRARRARRPRLRGDATGRADIPALHRLHPGLMTMDAWLEKRGKALFTG